MFGWVLGLATYLLATGAVLTTAVVLTFWTGDEAPGAFWFTAGLLSLGLIYGYVMLLGLVVRWLTTLSLLLVAVCVAAGTLAAFHRREGIETLYTALRSQARMVRDLVTGSRLLSVLVGIFALELVWLTALALLLPPLAWDSLAYHLPPVIEWMHAGEIYTVGYPPATQFPKNVEVFVFWNVVFPKELLLANFTQLGIALVGILGIYDLSKSIGLDEENAALAGFVFFFSPVVLMQATTTYVDLAFGALVLVTFATLLRFVRERTNRNAILLGIAVGLMFGSKSTGVLFALIVAGVVLLAALDVLRADRSLPSALTQTRLLSLVLVPVVLFGGYWYVRNLVRYGNPIHPVAVEPFGIEIFEGSVDRSNIGNRYYGPLASSIHGSFDERSMAEIFYLHWYEKLHVYTKATMSGWGPLWAIFGLPAIAMYGYRSLAQRRRRQLLVLALFILPLPLMIAPWYPRYNIYLLGLGAIAVGYVRQHVCVDTRQLLSIGVVVLVMATMVLAPTPNVWKHPDYIEDSLENPDNRTPMHLRSSFSPIQPDTYEKIVPPGSRIGFTSIYLDPNREDPSESRDFIFNLYDEDLRNRLVFLGDKESQSTFLTAVRERKVDVLIIPRGDRHNRWLRAAPDIRQIHRNDDYNVYRVGDRDA